MSWANPLVNHRGTHQWRFHQHWCQYNQFHSSLKGNDLNGRGLSGDAGVRTTFFQRSVFQSSR